MKHLKKDFCTFLGIILALLPSKIWAEQVLDAMDSIEVSLLTCSPHEEIYSLYGHTALRWHDLRTDEDIAFNWGIFDFNKPHFVPRFVFGLTDYELGIVPIPYFIREYQQVGSSVTEQVLNLTSKEKLRLKEALQNNLAPENKVYRYNYFYDNCSTRPRDIIESVLDGKLEYQSRKDYKPSYREIIHFCARNHPWAIFGNDMLLGIKADFETNLREQEFLPANLLYDFDRATIDDGFIDRPLVKERRMLVEPGVQVIEKDFPITPIQMASILLLLSIFFLWIEWHHRKILVAWDVILMVFQGLIGCVLFVMLFSQHPTVSTNLQLLLFNPLPLFFIPAVIKKRPTHFWALQLVMVLLFLVGRILQVYAEGMIIVALCLLLRTIKGNKLRK